MVNGLSNRQRMNMAAKCSWRPSPKLRSFKKVRTERHLPEALAFGDGTWPNGALPCSGKTWNIGKMVWFCQLRLGLGCKDRPGGLGFPLQAGDFWSGKRRRGSLQMQCESSRNQLVLCSFITKWQQWKVRNHTIRELKGLYSLQVVSVHSMAKSPRVLLWAKETVCYAKFGMRVYSLHIKYPGKAATCTKKKRSLLV